MRNGLRWLLLRVRVALDQLWWAARCRWLEARAAGHTGRSHVWDASARLLARFRPRLPLAPWESWGAWREGGEPWWMHAASPCPRCWRPIGVEDAYVEDAFQPWNGDHTYATVHWDCADWQEQEHALSDPDVEVELKRRLARRSEVGEEQDAGGMTNRRTAT